jgi:hypothetical protein
MLTRFIVFLFGLLSVVALSPVETLACACCAEPGTYFLSTYKPRSFETDLLKELRFEKNAKLYMTEAGFEMVKGLDEIRKESEIEAHAQTYDDFDLVNGFNGRSWRFEMVSAGGKKGILTLPMPATMVNYKVDIHDEEDRPNGPLLYKEYRFKGDVASATGIFRTSSIRPLTYFLVFHGRGVGCDESYNYTHWRLEISGPKAEYAFYGKLDAAAAGKAAAGK